MLVLAVLFVGGCSLARMNCGGDVCGSDDVASSPRLLQGIGNHHEHLAVPPLISPLGKRCVAAGQYKLMMRKL